MFYAIPWSYGTIGLLVAAEIKIVPATKFVKLEYQPVRGRLQVAEKFKAASTSEEKFDFVEALMYDRDSAVLMTGRLTNSCMDSQVRSDLDPFVDSLGVGDGSVVEPALRDMKVLRDRWLESHCSPPAGPSCHRCALTCLETESNLAPHMAAIARYFSVRKHVIQPRDFDIAVCL